ncbi:MAG: hypothetical protein R2708_09035 [Vicinamibacterales bacterium]
MREIIQNAPFGVFLAMMGIPLLMAGVAIFAGIRGRQTAALMKSTTAVPIGMATNGYRQFEGRVEAIGGQTVRAPLTGADCVWYEARLEEWRRQTGDRRRYSWHTVREVTSSAPLLVRDATGAALIRPYGARMTPTDKSRWTGAGPEPDDRNPPRMGPSDSFEAGLQVSGGPNSRYRYTEARIYAGDPLMVLGQFDSGRFTPSDDDDEDEDGSFAEDLADTSEDADGDLSPHAWEAANEERTTTLTRRGREVTKAWVTAGGSGQPLIVAATTAAHHAEMNELGSKAAFTIALLPLAIAALVLLARLG